MIMKLGYYLLTACLLAASLLAQTEQSKLERSIPLAKLQELIVSREQAQEELRASGDTLSPEILHAFLEPNGSIAIVKMEQVITTDRGSFTVTLGVEKALRGTPPAKVPVECYWSERPWPLRPPPGAQRIKPQTGKRILASFGAQNSSTTFRGMLDLDDPAEAAFLPRAITMANMDADAATSGASVYERGLMNEGAVVRDLALQRLLHTKECLADSHCEQSVLAEARQLLAHKNLNDRVEAVRWLGNLSQLIQQCQVPPCAASEFHSEPVRKLLRTALTDKNVTIGDLAFQYLATLDFHKKENAGYCEEIVPALRVVDRYPLGGEHGIGGRLNGTSTCVGPTHK